MLSIDTSPMASRYTEPHQFFLSFTQFIKEYNVVGLGLGALVATNTMEIGKAFTDSVIMPLVTGLITQTIPEVSYYSLVQTLLTFIVTMFAVFLMIRLFNVKLTKPVALVQIVEGFAGCHKKH
jgi:large-conductance mechanosensitive channel